MTDETNPEDGVSSTVTRDRTLFVRAGGDSWWTAEQIDNLVESIDSVTPEDVGVMAVTDDIEYLGQEEVEEFVEELTSSLE